METRAAAIANAYANHGVILAGGLIQITSTALWHYTSSHWLHRQAYFLGSWV